MATYTEIASVTVGSGGAASMSFSSIPSTYTDLKIVVSARNSGADNTAALSFNGSTSNFSSKVLYGSGSSAASLSDTTSTVYSMEVSSSYTSSTFSNAEIYIPNYAGSTYKSFSLDSTTENNATVSYAILQAGLWSQTAAITSIGIACNSGNFVQYSTAYLYGIKKD